jgi:hypothetical protein
MLFIKIFCLGVSDGVNPSAHLPLFHFIHGWKCLHTFVLLSSKDASMKFLAG